MKLTNLIAIAGLGTLTLGCVQTEERVVPNAETTLSELTARNTEDIDLSTQAKIDSSLEWILNQAGPPSGSNSLAVVSKKTP